MLVYLTRKARFNAAHRMYQEEWTTEENFKALVTIKGHINYEIGYLIDLKELKVIINEHHRGIFLHSVRLYATQNNSAEYFGDEGQSA